MLKRFVQPITILIVLIGIAHSLRHAWDELRTAESRAFGRIVQMQQRMSVASEAEKPALMAEIEAIERSQFHLRNVRWRLWLGAIGVSWIAMVPPAIFWWLTLRKFGHSLPFLATQSIYSLGNLGKYVPGKAMVVILRSGGMRRLGVPVTTSVVSIFVETFTSLAVGGAMGTAMVAWLGPPRWLVIMSIGASIIAVAPTIPAIFRITLKMLGRLRHLKLPESIASAMDWRLVLWGWILLSLGWLAMGTSLWMVCEAIRPNGTGELIPLESMPVSTWKLWRICMAASTLGFVVGFISMLPGGAGVREVVVTLLLAPAMGYAPALAAAVLYRVANLAAELAMAGSAWLLSRTAISRSA